MFLTLPGLYQMLPSALAADEPNLFDASQWPKDELAPDVKMLARAHKVRSRMPPPDGRCAVIVGTDQETVTSVTVRDGGFEYSVRRDGDGTVPLARALWDGADTWFAAENHGGLTNNNEVLAAVTSILKEGQAPRLSDHSSDADDGRGAHRHGWRAARGGDSQSALGAVVARQPAAHSGSGHYPGIHDAVTAVARCAS